MRIISSQLRQIIREEVARSLREGWQDDIANPRDPNAESRKAWNDKHDGTTTASTLITKLTSYQDYSNEDVGGLIAFFEREKDSSKRGDEVYVLKRKDSGKEYGVYMHSTWPEHKQHRIDIPAAILSQRI